jgi:aldehyde:ferredoxin oxidoreductase
MLKTDIDGIRAGHKTLAYYQYSKKPVERGYTNRTLYINISDLTIKEKPVSPKMKEIFTGGRGFCLWLLWNAVTTATKWNSPENELVIAGGPIGGITQYPGSGKATVVTVSPLTHSVIDSNSGGYFGPYLKFAGFDALEVQGKSDKEIIIFIDGDNGAVTIEEAPLEALDTHIINRQLTEIYAENEQQKRGISVISAGQAADNVPITGLNISFYDPKRKEIRIKQAARGGAGRVLRDKKIKAIVVKYSSLSGDNNGAANMELLRKAGKRINKEITDFDAVQNNMRQIGTPYLVGVMNDYDLLPSHNYKFGAVADSKTITGDIWKSVFDLSAPDGCWFGCTLACAHLVDHFHVQTGPYAGEVVIVDGPEYETLGGLGTNIGIYDPQAILEMNFYCDTYGIDTISLANSVAFAMECYENGIISSKNTGGLDLIWGNYPAIIEMIHQMARGEGFGMILGQGVRAMKKIFASEYNADSQFLKDIGMENKGLEFSEYMTKESLAQQGGYALANKGAQHDDAWLIFIDMVHKLLPTFEAKAEALHYFPVWRTWFSLHGLCKLPWNDIIPESNKTAKEPAKVPEHVENYTWLYEGVTGIKVTPEDLMLQSERVYNFQRVFNLKLGYGTREYDYPPYRAMGPVTEEEYLSRVERYDKELLEQVGFDPKGHSTVEKVKVVREYREDRYEKLVDAVYKRRGWDERGIPMLETLQRLEIDFPDVVQLIKSHQK